MTTVAVIVHTGKTLGGGPAELRRALAAHAVTDPLWAEVPKSKKAPARVKKLVDRGADLVFVWGGDGMVQRCIDTLAGSDVSIAIVPAGTANLLATNLGIPQDIEQAVDVGLRGDRRPIDVGRINGERFAVMAGTGLDAFMIRDADAGMKDKIGSLAYVITSAKHLRERQMRTRIEVDGMRWYKGKASCVLFGNVGQILGGIRAFEDASPDDGRLEIGVVTAKGIVEWARTIGRTAVGQTERSPFVHSTTGRTIKVKLDRKIPYELDGGDRPAVRKLKVKIEPGAITICVPGAGSAPPPG